MLSLMRNILFLLCLCILAAAYYILPTLYSVSTSRSIAIIFTLFVTLLSALLSYLQQPPPLDDENAPPQNPPQHNRRLFLLDPETLSPIISLLHFAFLFILILVDILLLPFESNTTPSPLFQPSPPAIEPPKPIPSPDASSNSRLRSSSTSHLSVASSTSSHSHIPTHTPSPRPPEIKASPTTSIPTCTPSPSPQNKQPGPTRKRTATIHLPTQPTLRPLPTWLRGPLQSYITPNYYSPPTFLQTLLRTSFLHALITYGSISFRLTSDKARRHIVANIKRQLPDIRHAASRAPTIAAGSFPALHDFLNDISQASVDQLSEFLHSVAVEWMSLSTNTTANERHCRFTSGLCHPATQAASLTVLAIFVRQWGGYAQLDASMVRHSESRRQLAMFFLLLSFTVKRCIPLRMMENDESSLQQSQMGGLGGGGYVAFREEGGEGGCRESSMGKLLPRIWDRGFVPAVSRRLEGEEESVIRDALLLDCAMNGLDDVIRLSVKWPASRVARATWLYSTGKLYVKKELYDRLRRNNFESGSGTERRLQIPNQMMDDIPAHHVLTLAVGGLCCFRGGNDGVYRVLEDLEEGGGVRVEGSMPAVTVGDLVKIGLVVGCGGGGRKWKFRSMPGLFEDVSVFRGRNGHLRIGVIGKRSYVVADVDEVVSTIA